MTHSVHNDRPLVLRVQMMVTTNLPNELFGLHSLIELTGTCW